jgi:2-polyprenyl-3-methyl-5-hydroxy-6-metoxy-1,4-benzoquinol methylase
MSSESLRKIYENHHTDRERRDFSILQNDRGEFLRRNIGTGKKVLDIGCRDGVLTSEYSKGNDVLGFDIDSIALETAKENLGIETRQVDLYSDWDVENKSFDIVVAGEVLEHLYYPGKIVGKAASVLKDGGVLLGSVPNAFSLKNRIRLFLGKKKGTPLEDPTHINHFSRKELATLLEKSFKKVSIIPLGNFAKFDKFLPGMFAFDLMFKASGPKYE